MGLIIKNRALVDDDWSFVRLADEPAPLASLAVPEGAVILPLRYWIDQKNTLLASRGKARLGVWLAPDEEPSALAADMAALSLIAIHFPTFGDGRALSMARTLRERFGWQGELRAIGDVLRDALLFQERCGFNSFSIRPDKNAADALRAFSDFSSFYQNAADSAQPMFRTRSEALALLNKKNEAINPPLRPSQ